MNSLNFDHVDFSHSTCHRPESQGAAHRSGRRRSATLTRTELRRIIADLIG